jgi:hypothetical protein
MREHQERPWTPGPFPSIAEIQVMTKRKREHMDVQNQKVNASCSRCAKTRSKASEKDQKDTISARKRKKSNCKECRQKNRYQRLTERKNPSAAKTKNRSFAGRAQVKRMLDLECSTHGKICEWGACLRKMKNSSHWTKRILQPVFACGRPPYYWQVLSALNFADRTGSGAFTLVWPNPRIDEFHQNMNTFNILCTRIKRITYRRCRCCRSRYAPKHETFDFKWYLLYRLRESDRKIEQLPFTAVPCRRLPAFWVD